MYTWGIKCEIEKREIIWESKKVRSERESVWVLAFKREREREMPSVRDARGRDCFFKVIMSGFYKKHAKSFWNGKTTAAADAADCYLWEPKLCSMVMTQDQLHSYGLAIERKRVRETVSI